MTYSFSITPIPQKHFFWKLGGIDLITALREYRQVPFWVGCGFWGDFFIPLRR
jgi:hypothetical protein